MEDGWDTCKRNQTISKYILPRKHIWKAVIHLTFAWRFDRSSCTAIHARVSRQVWLLHVVVISTSGIYIKEAQPCWYGNMDSSKVEIVSLPGLADIEGQWEWLTKVSAYAAQSNWRTSMVHYGDSRKLRPRFLCPLWFRKNGDQQTHSWQFQRTDIPRDG